METYRYTVYKMMAQNWECLTLLGRKWRASQSRQLENSLEEGNDIKQKWGQFLAERAAFAKA